MNRSRLTSLMLGIFCIYFVVIPIFAQTNYVLTTKDCDVCDEKDIKEWRIVTNNMLGVAGRDPEGHKIGSFSAKQTFNGSLLSPFLPRASFGIGGWSPVEVFKQTCCGKLDKFSVQEGYSWSVSVFGFDLISLEADPDEMDWENYIIPDPYFSRLIRPC